MKPSTLVALAAVAVIATYSTDSYAIGTVKSNAELKIEFTDADQYTDMETSFGSTDKTAGIIKDSVAEAFQRSANKYLPSGYSLNVSVENIDLAGDRSVLTSTFGDIRVYRDIFPPRIAFSYEVRSPSDQLVASGEVSKSDLSYLQTYTGFRFRSEEEAPFVTELVRGWASTELRRAVAKS